MKKLISVSVVWGIILASFAMADPGDTLWTRTYGGNSYDEAYCVQQTGDGGYIVAGRTESFGAGGNDLYLVKTGPNGDTLWTRTYGGSANDYGYSVQQTSDGRYIIAGYTDSFGAGLYDVYLLKTDTNGDTLWTRTYGGSGADYGWSVQQTTDGGYIIAGMTDSFGAGDEDVYLVKTDANGDTLWTRTYGGNNIDWSYCVQQTSDGGYIIAGTTMSFGAGNNDFWLVKTDANGDTLWTRTYGGSSSEDGRSVQQTSDGGYIIGGTTMSFGAGLGDFWLLKTDANGDTLWTRTYGGSLFEFGYSVQQTPNGGYIIGGTTMSFGAGIFDLYLVKTDTNGDTLWTRTYGGSSSDYGYFVQQTTGGGYIVAGYTSSFGAGSNDFWLLKVAGEAPVPDVSIDMIPDNPPVTVPAGGSFTYTGIVTNNTDDPITTDVWIMLELPGGATYGPVLQFNNIILVANQTISVPGITQDVPWYAPLGTYDYIAYCGDYPVKMDSASFEFTVTAPIAGGGDDWNLYGWFGEEIDNIPAGFALLGNFPNPFNAQTNIAYNLPISGNVTLKVYNLRGQNVATLVDGNVEAGQHSVTWDASNFSSGIYFYKLTAGDKVFTKRMTLLK